MKATQLRVTTRDGWALGVEHRPASRARGVAILLHAMMVDRRTLDRPGGRGLASALARHGWEVLLADFRGHGASGPTPRIGGSWSYDDLVLYDVPALVDGARATFPGHPVAVVGHSLGGHVAIASAGGHLNDADLHVLLAANVWLPSLEPSRVLRARKAMAIRAFRSITRRAGRFPSRALRMGPADEAAAYVEDLCGFWTSDRWIGRTGRDWQAAMGRVRGPVLSVLACGDRLLGAPVAAEAWASRLPDVELRHAGRGRGLSFDPGHMELATDARCAPIWNDIATWMGDHVLDERRG